MQIKSNQIFILFNQEDTNKKLNELIQCLERGHKAPKESLTCTLKYTYVKHTAQKYQLKRNSKLRQIKSFRRALNIAKYVADTMFAGSVFHVNQLDTNKCLQQTRKEITACKV